MILMIDNYDSFVYNLYQYFLELGEKVEICRNDKITLEEIQRISPSHIILSPGPCTPNEAGICLDAIKRFGPTIPILGVCLGHQAIGQAYGGKVVRAKKPMHGKETPIHHDGLGVFSQLPQPLKVGRYHSLIVERDTLPHNLKITALSQEGEIMGLRHAYYPVEGVQFHPESILTEKGHHLLENFIKQGGNYAVLHTNNR
ncbi:MAG: aminodeoxychorismate/anthranilate synthase component II [Dehalobacterium sp.]